MADAWHIDAGGEQVDGDGDARVALVLVLADQLFDLVALPGDDPHGGLVVVIAVNVFEGFVEQVLHALGVGLVDAEDHRFLIA